MRIDQTTTTARLFTPSPGIPGEGGGEGSSANSALRSLNQNPHPDPLPGYRARGNGVRLIFVAMVFALAFGCGVDPKDRDALNAGFQALDQRQYDQAIQQSDEYLQTNSKGEGAAEAYYLRGQAFEQREAPSYREARANYEAARNSYNAALDLKPSTKLEGELHTGLGNVAYWTDDYAAAYQEWQKASELLEDPARKAYVVYRMGLSMQRLNRFEDADRLFAQVQQQYPGSEAAGRAKAKQGVRGFMIQLATYGNPSSADAAMQQLGKLGIRAGKIKNDKNQTIVSIGPVSTYQQAQQIKSRFAQQYPDALILP
jgi:TolA-binding protein